MSVEEVRLDHGHRGLELSDDHIRVVVLPDKGCDIYSIVDRKTDVDVLFKSPWGLLPQAPGAASPDSVAHWLRHYPGGWQVILPNGGAEARQSGAVWGFHGEASLVGWDCKEVEGGVDASTRLFYAPLTLERQFRLIDGRFHLRETVTNDSPDRLEFMWGHHPAFGQPLLEPGSRIATRARTYVADDEQPGPMIEPGSRHTWPRVETLDGSTLDLSVVGSKEVAYLGYLTDFEDHWYTISNPRLELGVLLRWSPGVLDHAWFWQELHASPGFPWFRRAYVAAIEPNSTYPGQGVEVSPQKGGRLAALDGGASATVDLHFSLFHGGGDVTGIDGEGNLVRR